MPGGTEKEKGGPNCVGGVCDIFEGCGIGGEVCGVMGMFLVGQGTERSRICAEQISEVKALMYGGKLHANSEAAHGLAV